MKEGEEAQALAYVRHVKQGKVQSGPLEIMMPLPSVFHPENESYMGSANCQARDFYTKNYVAFCADIGEKVLLHRKRWEFAFISEHLSRAGALIPNSKGIGFGVGTEPLPALFASKGCSILATDAPPGAAGPGWEATNQWSSGIAKLFRPKIISEELLRERVRFTFCDMASIPDDYINNFDFCWSACCFEHLGSLERGADFVVESIEKTLRPGGIACHTSELNVSSNVNTVELGGTVLYRLQDVEKLIARIESRGHEVLKLPFEPGLSYIDHLVDVPPYSSEVHLKTRVGAFVTTSFGLVVRRGSS